MLLEYLNISRLGNVFDGYEWKLVGEKYDIGVTEQHEVNYNSKETKRTYDASLQMITMKTFIVKLLD